MVSEVKALSGWESQTISGDYGSQLVESRFRHPFRGFEQPAVCCKLLMNSPKARPSAGSRQVGYGVHVEGTAEFPGFSQFVDDRLMRGRL